MGNRKESPGKEVEVVCDEKIGALRRKGGGGDGTESTVRRKRGRPKRRWLDGVRDDIKEKGLSGESTTWVLHGGVCHRTSTPTKIWE